MATTNCYCTLAELKARLGVDDTTDDGTLKAVMESVSRLVDRYCGRKFYVETRTRYFTASNSGRLDLDDLLSVSTSGLTTDEDGDRTYETTWVTTDFDLEPFNALYESPPRPYTYILTTPDGDYSFPSTQKGVKVAGSWGFYSVTYAIDTLAAAITDAAATTFTASTGGVYSPGQTILVGSEQMHVQKVVGNTVTVTRGANGTTAATALISAAVYAYTYPMVSEAALLQCARIFARRNAPFGVTGNAEMGTLLAIPKLDSDVALMLDPLRSYWGF